MCETAVKRLKEYVENDKIYKNYKEGELINPSDFDNFCVQHCIDIELLIATLELYKGSLHKEHEVTQRVNDLEYDDCKVNSFLNERDYQEILKEVLNLKEKPKRVIDIGSNMNQYAYLFENENIDYIGVDLWNACGKIKPYESRHTKFIGAKYEDIADFFKDDVIISNLCVGYLVDMRDVKAKHLITNVLKDGKFVAKVWW